MISMIYAFDHKLKISITLNTVKTAVTGNYSVISNYKKVSRKLTVKDKYFKM